MQLRDYQQAAIDDLFGWWQRHRELTESPILVLPTGAGKSIVIAEIVRVLFDRFAQHHPRTLVIVPSKELAEQNAEKLRAILPEQISVGFYSASIGKKQPDKDVIVCTIGSVARCAHILGDVKCVIVDECHLINPDGAGQYRKFLNDLGKYCRFRVVGTTATPFRGNGIWLTSGKDPLFCGIAHETTIKQLLELGYLSPLVRPVDVMRTRIDASAVPVMPTGDYNEGVLSACVDAYVEAAAEESAALAADRKKWIAFLPTVETALHMVASLHANGITAQLVCGETPKGERARLIAEFRRGQIRCLVTVLALATGFDVPDVDCILWLRPTISPVLYVQGAGRGLRIAPGKPDCLWVDFTDTTERMGPIDTIKGRAPTSGGGGKAGQPFRLCTECGHHIKPASALVCPECGAEFEPPEKEILGASDAPVLSGQKRVKTYDVTRVTYSRHQKEGSPDSLRVDYWSGLKCVCSEWVCIEHTGLARMKAENWCLARRVETMRTVEDLILFSQLITRPTAVTVDESGKWPQLVSVDFSPRALTA